SFRLLFLYGYCDHRALAPFPTRRSSDLGSLAQIRDGSRVRGIAVTSLQRDPAVPDLPTFAEAGLPGFDVTAWFALYAPRGTPEPVVRALIDAARAALKAPELGRQFAAMGAQPGPLFGADLGAFEQRERDKWGKLVKQRGIAAK